MEKYQQHVLDSLNTIQTSLTYYMNRIAELENQIKILNEMYETRVEQSLFNLNKSNYISKDKIKDKIEELNHRIDKYREYTEKGIETDIEWVDNVADRQTLKILQDLLKEELK